MDVTPGLCSVPRHARPSALGLALHEGPPSPLRPSLSVVREPRKTSQLNQVEVRGSGALSSLTVEPLSPPPSPGLPAVPAGPPPPFALSL